MRLWVNSNRFQFCANCICLQGIEYEDRTLNTVCMYCSITDTLEREQVMSRALDCEDEEGCPSFTGSLMDAIADDRRYDNGMLIRKLWVSEFRLQFCVSCTNLCSVLTVDKIDNTVYIECEQGIVAAHKDALQNKSGVCAVYSMR